ncbi:hypothetical protein SAMN04488494_1332 [Xylanibacter ruminicola]|uniref:Uncharacterized protein n=1 Tax=Xylanibacter ruminicola TaxID=839 RepID=A0A1M7G376_XYLRU|nr:hypothetical protein SAMN04488494_1332 [Xylanibacter ruminicola]
MFSLYFVFLWQDSGIIKAYYNDRLKTIYWHISCIKDLAL